MTYEIPIEPLLRRLAETPLEFQAEPKIERVGQVHVAALVHDLLVGFGIEGDLAFLDGFGRDAIGKHRNAQKLVMIAVWLLSDHSFENAAFEGTALKDLLVDLIPDMADQSNADVYLHDTERREEFVRAVLAQLHYLPEGETPEQAADRLTRISSTQRKRLLSASRAAEVRAREVREALARKAAQESADKWTRE